jgi:hypothetical protein
MRRFSFTSTSKVSILPGKFQKLVRIFLETLTHLPGDENSRPLVSFSSTGCSLPQDHQADKFQNKREEKPDDIGYLLLAREVFSNDNWFSRSRARIRILFHYLKKHIL